MTSKVQQLRKFYEFQLDVFFNISLKNHYLYVQTPKVASTTVKLRLNTLEAEGTRIDPKSLPLHPTLRETIHVKPFQLPDQMFEDVITGSDFFRFCFVRNPHVRVLSCYLDKMVTKKNEAAGIYKALGLSLDTDTLSFDAFVGLLHDRAKSSHSWNPHWRPQHYILRPDLVPYTLIGKLESFDEDFLKLNEHLGGRLSVDLVRAPHRTSSSTKINEYYTPELRSKVDEIYVQDMEQFGY